MGKKFIVKIEIEIDEDLMEEESLGADPKEYISTEMGWDGQLAVSVGSI